ncbi:MAG: hypothetical protein AAF573_13570 [Bacteroidota bacterium]
MAKKKNSKNANVSKNKTSTTKKVKRFNDPDLSIEKGFWKKNTIPATLLFVLSLLLYGQTYNYDYILDDKIVYHENGLVKKGWGGIAEILTTESMVGYFGERKELVQGGRYRPLSLVTFAIEHSIFGRNNYKIEEYWTKEFKGKAGFQGSTLDKIKGDPYLFEEVFSDENQFLNQLAGAVPQSVIDQNREAILYHAAHSNSGVSHLVNALLYGLLCVLLFRVLSIIFPAIQKNWYMTLPFVAALLFCLHPVHVEAVANVKGRDEIMALLGALGATYFTLKYVAEEKNIYLVASGAVFLLGLLSKENTLTYLAVIPLTTYFFTKSSFKKNAISAIPLIVAVLVFLLMRQQAVEADHIFDFDAGKPSRDLMNNPFVQMDGSEKMATIFYTLGLYVKLLFFPHPLTHDYYPYHIPIMNWGNISALLSLLLYLGMGAFAVWGIFKKNIVAYGILLFLIPLSVVSNIFISVGTFMNERFLFFSSVGFCIVMAYWIARKLPGPVLNLGLLALLALGYTAKTFTRIPVWKNAYTLNASGVKESPNSARANLYMSTALFRKFYKKETDPTQKQAYLNEVRNYVNKALEIHTNYGSAITMKVIVGYEDYKKSRNMANFLSVFESIIRNNRPMHNTINTYLNYFSKEGTGSREIAQFAHRVGFEHLVQQRGNYQAGLNYINIGLQASPSDAQLQTDRALTQQMMGK